MEDHTLLIADLLIAAGPVLTHAANALPDNQRELLAAAMAEGAKLELRVTPDAERTDVSVWIIRTDGAAFQVSTYNPAAARPAQKPH